MKVKNFQLASILLQQSLKKQHNPEKLYPVCHVKSYLLPLLQPWLLLLLFSYICDSCAHDEHSNCLLWQTTIMLFSYIRKYSKVQETETWFHLTGKFQLPLCRSGI